VSFVIRAIQKHAPFLIILNRGSAYYLNDLEQMIGDKDVLFYPGSYRRPYQIEDTDNANVLLRAQQNQFPQETGYNCDLSRSAI
jgi:transcription-repair coupling factor (superfamily II helicase)